MQHDVHFKLPLLLLLLRGVVTVDAIVNPANQTANMVIYLRRPTELALKSWLAGIDCIDEFARIFFRVKAAERYTRAYNMVLTNAHNMTTSASQIQDGFLKRANEAVTKPATASSRQRDHFQLRIINDRVPYKRTRLGDGRELLLADYYVIIVDRVSRLQSLMRNYISKMRSWNPGGRFIVVYHNEALSAQPHDIAAEIFTELMDSFYVFRVALLFAVSANQYNFLVNDYYSNVDCRILNVQNVGACRDGSLYPNPKKVDELMSNYVDGFSPRNCTFYVCATIAAPFVEEDCVQGIELRLLNFMRNRLQFTINQTCEHETRGVVDKSGNWTGLLGQLTEGNCDFLMGGFYPDNDVLESFWTSDCYLADSHTWYVKLAELRQPWQALVSIFEPITWLGFVVLLVICWLFWYALAMILPEPMHYQEFALTGINTLAVSICVSVYERPICQASRIFFIALALYGLNVVCTYTSKMIETFQHPGYEHQMDVIEEVISAGIPFGGSEESRDWFENDEDMWIFDAYNDSDLFEPITANLLAVKHGERVILSNRMYTMQSNLSDSIYAFPKNVFSSPVQMIMKAGFPFIYEINWHIRLMRDMGIFAKLDNDFTYNNTYLNRIARMRPVFEQTAIVLTTKHLQGPFAILIVGVCCSTLTFLGEVLFHCCLVPLLTDKAAKDLANQKKNNQESVAKRNRKRKIGHRRNFYAGKKVHVMREIRFTPIKRRKVL